jgi:hypothetical protein
MASFIPSMETTAFVDASPPASPSARFATPTAADATFRLASAAASPTRAGAVASDTMPLAKSMPTESIRGAPRRPRPFQADAMILGRLLADDWHRAFRNPTIIGKATFK